MKSKKGKAPNPRGWIRRFQERLKQLGEGGNSHYAQLKLVDHMER